MLRYRLGERYHSDVSLLDGLRAVRLVRHRAADFGIAENRMGMLGFSAGGHLAVAVGTRWDAGDPEAVDPIERASSRPDFLVPVYAVTNGILRGRKADEYTPADVRVNESTPPAFLVHTHEDGTVPASQSTLFYDALLAAGVQAELHISRLRRTRHRTLSRRPGFPRMARSPGQFGLRRCRLHDAGASASGNRPRHARW